MRHVPSPVLRRLTDDPLAVPDSARRHLAGCDRCQGRSAAAAANAALASRLLSAPPRVGDIDLEWIMLQHRLRQQTTGARRPPVTVPRRLPLRLARISLGIPAVVTAAVIAAGAAAAVTLTTVYAPTHVAPVQVSASDLRAVSDITGMSPQNLATGLPTAGSVPLPFGELSWKAAGQAREVSSAAQARALTHLPYAAPSSLPAGVGSAASIEVQPQVTATVQINRDAAGAGPDVAGSTLTITAGPAILVQYGGGGGSGDAVPVTLVIVEMQRPLVTSTGASASKLETFLLSQPGIPAGLAQQIRLLGNPGTVLPVPVPSGLSERQVTIGGSAAVLVADPAGTASGVVWEDQAGVVHGVGGLLDSTEILDVARQVG